MRILQACPYSWHAAGGVQGHVRHLAAQLLARGHKVLVLAPGRHAAIEPWVHVVGRPIAWPFNGSRVPICFGLRAALAVREAVRRFAPDIIHVHEHLSPSVSMLATIFAEVPVVATFHARYEPSVSALLYSAEARLLRPLSRRVSLGIAVSESAASSIAGRAPIALRIIPNGIDPERFAARRQPTPRRSLLFVNRLEPRKGFAVAVQAFAALAERFPDVDLVVVGEGTGRTAVRRLEPSIRARVTMLGAVHDDEVPTHYGRANVFLAPATGREGFGIVLLEAMAAGVPIVASDIDGYREVVRDGVEGLLIPPADPAALAAALARILDDEALAKRLGDAGRIRVQEYAWPVVTRRVETIYEQLLD